MLEKRYCTAQDAEITLTKQELDNIVNEAKASVHENLMRENMRLKEVLKAVSVIIKMIVDE